MDMFKGHLIVFVVISVLVMGGHSGKMIKKGKWGLTKNISWFRVEENDRDQCKHIEEDAIVDKRVEGPPAYACQEDKERFCLCAKRGVEEKKDWRYMCGRCRKNEPYSFKIDLDKKKGTIEGKRKNDKKTKNQNKSSRKQQKARRKHQKKKIGGKQK